MDRFVTRTETNKSTFSSASSSNPKHKSQAEKDKEYDKKRKREFQENLLVDFPWLWRDDKADAYCTYVGHALRTPILNFVWTSKKIFGQVDFYNPLVHGQVTFFDISAALNLVVYFVS